MSEMGEDFAAMSRAQQEKKAKNREVSAANLPRAGINFTSRNLGAHLIVEAGDQIIDFWPGTRRWIPRHDQQSKNMDNKNPRCN